MRFDRKTWFIWSIGVALALFAAYSSLIYPVPELVGLTTSWVGVGLVSWAVVHHFRRQREWRDVDTVFARSPSSAVDSDEVRELRGLLASLLADNDLGFPLRVTGSAGGCYLLSFNTVANVQPLRLDGSPSPFRLCVYAPIPHPNLYVQIYGSLIAQVLALTTDERQFLRAARGSW